MRNFKTIDPAWQFALGAYLTARIALSAWSIIIATIFPVTLQNLDLFGAPVLAVFDLWSNERYAYSRVIAGDELTFRLNDSDSVIDMQTNSVWSLRDGRALSGEDVGRVLGTSPYSIEEIFPYHGVASDSNQFLALWQRFDVNWYLAIAERGYDASDGSTVYFPIYPLLIRLVSVFVGDGMFAALLVSNLTLIGALAFLYRLTDELSDAASARRAVTYTILFPTGFFLFAAYTEALFLFFVLGAFVYGQRNRWYVAAAFGALAALTRLQGGLLVVPLTLMWWRQLRITHRTPRFTGGVLFLIPIATFTFLVATNLSLLNSYVGELHARFVLPWDNILASLALIADGKASFIDMTNLVMTIGIGGMLIAVWRNLPREFTVYTSLMFLAPMFRMTATQPLVSMDRYALVLFPVFILLGVGGKHAWVNRVVVYLCFPLQLYLSAQFVLWGWVG